MISRTLKLKPTTTQAARLDEWLMIGASVWNWGLARLIHTEREHSARRENFASLCAATRGHAVRVGVDAMAFQAILKDLCRAWGEYRSGVRGRPRWKGARNRMASIPFRNEKRANNLRIQDAKHVRLPKLGLIRCRVHSDWPPGQILTARLQRRARGWYLTVVIDAEPKTIPLVGDEAVGIDLGFSTLATLSNGEKIEHPREYELLERRIGQAQRGHNTRLHGRLQQSLALARRKRNHAISRDLVSRFGAIYVSKDNLRAFQRRGFGKSVLSAAHGELRTMLATKCRQAGRVYVEVPNKNSTRTCSSCGALTGPQGLRGLSVRVWACACGATHDRDVNAAINTLKLGAVLAHESARESAPEIGRDFLVRQPPVTPPEGR